LVTALELMEHRMQTRTLEGAFQWGVAHEPEVVHVRWVDVHTDETTTGGVTRYECDARVVYGGGRLLRTSHHQFGHAFQCDATGHHCMKTEQMDAIAATCAEILLSIQTVQQGIHSPVAAHLAQSKTG
jgi:hypothetical protein